MATWVEQNQCPLHQSILLTQGPIHEIFMKKYWELTKPWKWLLFSFLVFGFWLLGWSKNFFFGFSVWKKPRRFIWGTIYSCTMDGFFTIFKKAASELICTRLYIRSSLRSDWRIPIYVVWQYGLWIFQTGNTKLESFLPKNKHIKRKLLNFGLWINGELQKVPKFDLPKSSAKIFLILYPSLENSTTFIAIICSLE